MKELNIQVPEDIQQATDAVTGVAACTVMFVCGVVKGAMSVVKFAFGGVFRIIGGAVSGGYAAAKSSEK